MRARLYLLPLGQDGPRIDPLGPAAVVTRDLGVRTRVLLSYGPDVVEQARLAADVAGVDLTIEVTGDSACFSFACPWPDHEMMEGGA